MDDQIKPVRVIGVGQNMHQINIDSRCLVCVNLENNSRDFLPHGGYRDSSNVGASMRFSNFPFLALFLVLGLLVSAPAWSSSLKSWW